MPSITNWMRLEPRSRSAEMTTSLQARLYDPLWLLARQWQLGEFKGEDAGSPVTARWRGESAPLTRYHAGPIAANTRADASHYDGTLPLEVLVEREPVRADMLRPTSASASGTSRMLRLAAESGQHFLRVLAQQPMSGDYRAAFVREYPFPALTPDQRATLDADSVAFADLMAARVPDGRLLHAAFRPAGGSAPVIASTLGVASGDRAEVESAARLWLHWLELLIDEPAGSNPTWSAERMEYAFSVAARLGDGERILTAQEYSGGRLDWHTFDANAEVTLGATADAMPVAVTATTIPAPVSFRGMPSPRFWEFEDAQIDFGSVDAGPTDLARMLLVEFALTYGNDWFIIPVELAAGALHRTHSLVITDTFGTRLSIRSSSELGEPNSLWRMYQLSPTRASGLRAPASNLFFLAPSLVQSLDATALEEVLFLRDEMANLAWAVERTVESGSEQPIKRFEVYVEQQRRRALDTPAPSPSMRPLRYRLATEVPDYWIPLMPVRTAGGLRLRRGAVLQPAGAPDPVRAMGRILNPSVGSLELYEEEVPREGVRVARGYRYARGKDGSAHLWMGRRKTVGRGEGSSGLRFDDAEEQRKA